MRYLAQGQFCILSSNCETRRARIPITECQSKGARRGVGDKKSLAADCFVYSHNGARTPLTAGGGADHALPRARAAQGQRAPLGPPRTLGIGPR